MTAPIDLRSDTVTQPSPAMRKAMAEATVGDDVYGEDPTVNRLQDEVAELLGMEAALFTPTGSMADQIAVKVLTQPGDAVICGPNAHIAFHEAGATALLSSVQFSFMPRGIFSSEDLRGAFHENDHHHPPTTLLEIENTYNMGGGQVWPVEQMRETMLAGKKLGMNTMLDGARLWNAAIASKASEASLCRGFDMVTVCLSKGLGAPVGSLIAGNVELIRKAHRVRKMLGGGMRQAGHLAAAGLHALHHNRERLALDHDNARFLAEGIAELKGLALATETVDSNILMIELAPAKGSASDLQARAASEGLVFWAAGPQRFRLVTHLDVSRSDCERALEVLKSCLGS